MFTKRLSLWLPLLVLALWPASCAIKPHTFLSDSEAAAGSVDETGGASSGAAGRGSGAAGAHSGGGNNANGGSSEPGAGSSGESGEGPAGGSSATGGTSNGGSPGSSGAGSSGAHSGGAGTSGGGAGGSGATTAGAGGAAPVAPTVVMVTPANGATAVRSDAVVVIHFSEPMDKLFTQGAFSSSTLPPGTFSWNADATVMTYTPGTPLTYNSGTVASSVSAKVYSYTLDTTAKSAGGLGLASGTAAAFSTARQISGNIFATELWDVNSSGATLQCIDDCDGDTVGDTASNVIERGIFHYVIGLPANAFVQDVTMNLGVYFANGTVNNFGTLQIGKATGIVYAETPTTAYFTFTIGAHGTMTTATSNAAVLLSNGSFGTTDLYLSVLWSLGTDSDGTYDEVFVSDGHLAIHYLVP